jgi:hypothetical protein
VAAALRGSSEGEEGGRGRGLQSGWSCASQAPAEPLWEGQKDAQAGGLHPVVPHTASKQACASRPPAGDAVRTFGNGANAAPIATEGCVEQHEHYQKLSNLLQGGQGEGDGMKRVQGWAPGRPRVGPGWGGGEPPVDAQARQGEAARGTDAACPRIRRAP